MLFFSLQQRTIKCPSTAPESPPVHRGQRVSSRSTASAMKSDGLGTANKPGEGQTSKGKNVKKPGERSVAAKAKAASTATPVVNGTGAAGARRDVSSANGSRHGAKETEKKPNPGARPKSSPPSCTSTSQAAVIKAQKSSVGKSDSTAQPCASSTSDSASPENGASSPRSDTLSTPGFNSLLTSLHLIILSGTNADVEHHQRTSEASASRLQAESCRWDTKEPVG